MKLFQDRMFQTERFRAPSEFADLRLERCLFSNCLVGTTTYAGWRVQIRNVEIVHCSSLAGTRVGPVIAEDCFIDGLQTDDRITALSQPLLKHVVIRGRIGKLGIGDKPVLPSSAQSKREYEALEAALTAEKEAFYKTVDWALDISEAEAEYLSVYGIPLNLIRRDAKSQIIVQRSKLEDPEWEKALDPDNWWRSHLRGCPWEYAEILLVAPKNCPPRKYQKILRDLYELRDKGFTKPD
ncbi:MAG: hypothetical protein ACYCUV_13615 [Phycisphaerae bacterium]